MIDRLYQFLYRVFKFNPNEKLSFVQHQWGKFNYDIYKYKRDYFIVQLSRYSKVWRDKCYSISQEHFEMLLEEYRIDPYKTLNRNEVKLGYGIKYFLQNHYTNNKK
jgi:hypothetical protein